jgi:hypothetical protein
MRSHLRQVGTNRAAKNSPMHSARAQTAHGHETPAAPLPQQRIGNRGMQRMLYSSLSDANGGNARTDYKTTASAGGLSGISLDVTFSVSGTKADSLQAVQTVMTTRSGPQIGKYTWQWNGKTWDAFVDGGKNSPFVTLMGNAPAHPTKPYYLTASEVATQVTFAGDSGTIRVTDTPAAVFSRDEAHFETAIVAVNYNGGTKDKVLKVFKWGWLNNGTDPTVGKYWSNSKIGGVDSGISIRGSVSPEFTNIVKFDYPKYKFF